MRVFLTGGSGYVGSHIAQRLAAAGHELSILCRAPDQHPSLARLRGVRLVAGDLRDLGALEAALPGHDALVHNALLWDRPSDDRELVDTRAAAKLFATAGALGIEQGIFTSSTAVHRPFLPSMNEASPMRPEDDYGATKACGEVLLGAVARQVGMRFNVVRLAPVIGAPAFPEGRLACDGRFTAMARAAAAGEDLVVVEGDARQHISAVDAAEVYRALLESGVDREVFLAASRDFVRWEDVARLVALASRSPSRVVVVAASESAPSVGRFDVGKLARVLGLSFDSSLALRDHVTHVVRAVGSTAPP